SPKAPEALKTRAKEVFRSLRADGVETKALRGRVHFADENPDFVWQVTAEGFRIAPDGSDLAKLDTGAAIDISCKEPADELQQKTLRIMLRAYRVERLRRLSAKDAESSSDQSRLKVTFGVMPLTYDAELKKCVPGPQSEMKSIEGPLVAKPCSRV